MSIKNHITLHNGTPIPGIGFRMEASHDHIYASLLTALRAGYRLFDVNASAQLEKDFDKALQAGNVPRNQMFLITHIDPSSASFQAAIHGFRNTLSRIGTDYTDALIVDIRTILQDTKKVVAQWKAAETAYKNGVTRTIGITTDNPEDIETLLYDCEIAPMCNISCIYPGNVNQAMITCCLEHRILLLAAMPQKQESLMASKELRIFAEKYRVSPLEIQVQFLLQLDCLPMITVLTDSQQNKMFQASTFSISENDMKYLENMKDYGC